MQGYLLKAAGAGRLGEGDLFVPTAGMPSSPLQAAPQGPPPAGMEQSVPDPAVVEAEQQAEQLKAEAEQLRAEADLEKARMDRDKQLQRLQELGQQGGAPGHPKQASAAPVGQ